MVLSHINTKLPLLIELGMVMTVLGQLSPLILDSHHNRYVSCHLLPALFLHQKMRRPAYYCHVPINSCFSIERNRAAGQR